MSGKSSTSSGGVSLKAPSPAPSPPASSPSSSSSAALPAHRDEFRVISEDLERESREAEHDKAFVESIAKREIVWRGYEMNRQITQKELGFISDFDKQPQADQADQLEERGEALASLFVKLLKTIYSKDTVEYLIVMIYNILESDPKKQAERLGYFHAAQRNATEPNFNIYAPFLSILASREIVHHNVTHHYTAHILALLFVTAPGSTPASLRALQRFPAAVRALSTSDRDSSSIYQFVEYLVTRITTTPSSRDIIFALIELRTVLKRAAAIDAFLLLEGFRGLNALLSRETQNAQLLYAVGFSLWLLSFDPRSVRPIEEHGILKKLIAIVKINQMEKVVRICYAIFRNLLENSDKDYTSVLEDMIGLQLVQITDTLSRRKLKDADLQSDMESITSRLNDAIHRLSTFEIYHSEVTSGALTWSPVHRNEAFWRENVLKFEENNFRLVDQLVKLLRDPDPSIVEVSAFDLGEFARFHPEGRKVLTKLGGKARLMEVMQHRDAKVAKEALLAVQKLMVNNWEMLSKSAAGGMASLAKK